MKILFICKGNWFRSQMAAAIYNKLTSSNDAVSAGTYTGAPDEPEGLILADVYEGLPDFFEVMEANGMDVRQNTTVKLLPEMLNQADMVVSMAEEPYIPGFLKEDTNVVWWEVENPDFVTKEVAEKTYDKVFQLVRELVEKNG